METGCKATGGNSTQPMVIDGFPVYHITSRCIHGQIKTIGTYGVHPMRRNLRIAIDGVRAMVQHA
eukprot:6738130-Pyramimonas_sp.AAC.1